MSVRKKDSKPAKSAPMQLSRRRKWLFVFIASVVLPALLLGLVEGGLRLFGYGYQTDFLIRRGNYCQSNPRYGWRFFPRAVSRTPLAIHLPINKPAGTYRIFIIGGSAAQGYPDPTYSFSRFLEVMLRERFPAMRFEVANAAMTAANSHMMAPAARDCAKFDPDMLIVYMGNNEVVGPFGTGTVFMGRSSSLRGIRTGLWVKTTRIGQLMDNIGRSLSGEESVKWGGMEMFLGNLVAADDPRLARTYDHFRRNLQDICDAGLDAGAAVIVCTVPVNLRHCAPFGSTHRDGLSQDQLARWDGLYQQGVDHEQAGRHEQAIEHFTAALAIDDRSADLHFRLGRCYVWLDRPDEAGRHFAQAREFDALRFRADATINDTIRQVAAAAGEQVRLVDAEQAFSALADVVAGCPGEELFFDHVHPNYRGNYELARSVFRAVVEQLPAEIVADANVEAPVFERCCQLLALTHWDHLRNALPLWRLVARPPFTNQLNYADMRRRMLARREALWATTASTEDILAAYDLAVAAAPDDPMLHILAANAYGMQRDYPVVAWHLAEVKRLLPNEPRIHIIEARLHLHQNDPAGAQRPVAAYLTMMDHSLQGYYTVVALFKSCQDLAQAEAYARQAVQHMPKQAATMTLLARILEARQRYADAETVLRQATAIEPDHAEAWYMLGKVQFSTGRLREAISSLRRAIELDPVMAEAYTGMGNICLYTQQTQQAKAYFAKAVELSPDDLTATAQYAELLHAEGQAGPAVALLRRALRISPGRAVIEAKLAWMLATSADPQVRDAAEAIRLAEQAVTRDHGRPQSMVSLAAAYAADGQFDRAIETADAALSLARSQGDQALMSRIEGHLNSYRSRSPLFVPTGDDESE